MQCLEEVHAGSHLGSVCPVPQATHSALGQYQIAKLMVVIVIGFDHFLDLFGIRVTCLQPSLVFLTGRPG